MNDHPILIPTSKGPVGGVISEPEGAARAALILFQGGGPPARCGVNAIWTRIAHDLAAIGILVLRFDFACEADSVMVGMDATAGPAWRSAIDLPVTREVTAWFGERSGMGIIVAGSCYGARLALEVAAEDRRIEGAFLVTPYLAGVRRPKQGTGGGSAARVALAVRPDQAQSPNDQLGAVAVDSARAVLERQVPLWILLGEKDGALALELAERIGKLGEATVEVEVMPGIALHPGTDPAAQEAISRRTVERLEQALRARSAAA